MLVTQVLILEIVLESEEKRKKFPKYFDAFVAAKRKLLSQYYNLKTGLLQETQTLSSLREKVDNHYDMNCVVAKQFIVDIIDFTSETTKALRDRYEQQIQMINKLPAEVKTSVLNKIGTQFKQNIDKSFADIDPWVDQWCRSQAVSIMQREVFGKSR